MIAALRQWVAPWIEKLAPVLSWLGAWKWAAIGIALAYSVGYVLGNINRGADERANQALAVAKAVAASHKAERELHADALAAERAHIQTMQTQTQESSNAISQIRTALAQIPACPVPVAAIRVLNRHAADRPSSGHSAVAAINPRPPTDPDPAPAGAGDRIPAPPERADRPAGPVEQTVDARVIIDSCAINYEQVCEPNRRDLEFVIDRYNAVRDAFSKLRGRNE